jgi:hypothetical protein
MSIAKGRFPVDLQELETLVENIIDSGYAIKKCPDKTDNERLKWGSWYLLVIWVDDQLARYECPLPLGWPTDLKNLRELLLLIIDGNLPEPIDSLSAITFKQDFTSLMMKIKSQIDDGDNYDRHLLAKKRRKNLQNANKNKAAPEWHNRLPVDYQKWIASGRKHREFAGTYSRRVGVTPQRVRQVMKKCKIKRNPA